MIEITLVFYGNVENTVLQTFESLLAEYRLSRVFLKLLQLYSH